MKTEIINLAPVTIDTHYFKDSRLAEATAKIAEIYQNAAVYADEKNREIARVLATVATEKSYVKDGFKSVAEYANKIFGIARQNAYALATAGKFYNDDSVPDELKAFSPSKLAELSSVGNDKLMESIHSGEISADTTQKKLREYVQQVKKSKDTDANEKIKVLDTYTARPCMMEVSALIAEEVSSPRTIEEWDKYFCDMLANTTSADLDTIEIVKLPIVFYDLDEKKVAVTRKLYFNRCFSIVVEFFKVVKQKKLKKSVKSAEKPTEYTVEQLQSMLYAAMEEEKEKNQDYSGEEHNWDEE